MSVASDAARSAWARARSAWAVGWAVGISLATTLAVVALGGPDELQKLGPVAPLISLVAHAAVAITPASDFVPWGLANGAVFGVALGGALNWGSWLCGAGIQHELARRATHELRSSVGLSGLPRWMQRFPADHPVVLICARWLPLGGFVSTVTAGARGVPRRRVLVCAGIGLVPPSFVVAGVGAGLWGILAGTT